MIRRALLVSVGMMIAAVIAACGSAAAEPTAVPATATTAPTPLPQIAIITADPIQDFDGFISQMPDADIECLTSSLGMERLEEFATGADPEERESESLANCFSNELVAGFMVGQIQNQIESVSGSSLACIASLLDDIPAARFPS